MSKNAPPPINFYENRRCLRAISVCREPSKMELDSDIIEEWTPLSVI
jgi:hypothetical protein